MSTVGDDTSSTLADFVQILLMPPILFLGTFTRYFSAIDGIVSRSRELRADWIATESYGHIEFTSALIKTTQISAHFADYSRKIIPQVDTDYFEHYSNLLSESSSEMEGYKNKALSLIEHELDTHPTLLTRINNLPTKDVFIFDNQSAIIDARKEIGNKEKELSQAYVRRIKEINEYMEQMKKALQEMNQAEKVEENDRHVVITCGVCYKKILVQKGQNSVKLTCPCCLKEHVVNT
jgi:hypothetical protein